VLYRKLLQRKVFRIAGREPPAERERRGGNETVRLGKRAAAPGELAPPLSRLPAFLRTQGGDSQSGKERLGSLILARLEATNSLLHIDGRRIWRITRTAKCEQPLPRVGATSKEVDQDCGVQENWCQLPDAAVIRAPLVANPPARILVPLVTAVGNRANRRLDQLPALIVVKSTLDRPCDIRAAAAGADAAIQLVDELVRKGNVHSHGHNLAH
jgi:hypothetical protein